MLCYYPHLCLPQCDCTENSSSFLPFTRALHQDDNGSRDLGLLCCTSPSRCQCPSVSATCMVRRANPWLLFRFALLTFSLMLESLKKRRASVFHPSKINVRSELSCWRDTEKGQNAFQRDVGRLER